MGRLHYKGYTGSVEFSEEDNCFFGRVLGLKRTGILFEGDSIDSLRKDFEEGVDDYLAYCREKGIEPEKAYSGKLVLRMKSDLHSDAADKDNSLGISLNEFINRAIAAAL